ncbi:hypothetical protein [Methylopila sp. M107]|uniref:hypothetical protein n=1 Tax=Methylopila sp. M107 TaxID=1101190 RepID=UPI0003A6A9F8|nr:hypothetical protein [Methylopila sp. M107]
MPQSTARAALVPLTSSPRRLTLSAGVVIAAVMLIQAISGVPHWRDTAPIELSSNVVAVMGMAWAALQLRTNRADETLRNAWGAALFGMTLIAIDGDVVELVLQSLSDAQEMNVSIALWICAAGLFILASRRFETRREATLAVGAGVGLQILAQYAGWLSVGENRLAGGSEVAGFLNDLGELAAALAYLSALLLAEFAPVTERAAIAAAPARPAPAIARPAAREWGKVVRLSEFRRGGVRCPDAGVTFPQLFRISGFAWNRAGGPDAEREAHVAYAFAEDDIDGVEDATVAPVDRPDAALDSGWIVVRHHRSLDALDGYFDARRDFGLEQDCDIRRLVTSAGVFTVCRRPAPAEGPQSLILYCARVPTEDKDDDALWTLAVGTDDRSVAVGPARAGPGHETWID